MQKDKDRLLIVVVIALLFFTLWLVRCSKPNPELQSESDSTVLVLPDTVCDTSATRKPHKAKTEKPRRKPVERNYLDEKLSD